MNNLDDFLQLTREQFGPGVAPVADARSERSEERAPATAGPSLESSSLDTPRVVPLPGHVKARGLFNVTAVRYADGWSACVWQASDPVFRKKDRDPTRSKDQSERWESSKIRARARVRHLARCLGIDHLWTFTKRGKFESLDQLWVAWREFNRLMVKRYRRRWQYVAVPELHSDGESWHLHVGVKGFWDVNQLRGYWHRALGAPGLVHGSGSPGNVDAKWFRGGKSVRAIAGYITKYIAKGFGSVPGLSNRKLFSSTVGIRALERREYHFPAPVSWRELEDEMRDLLRSLSGGVWYWKGTVYGDGVTMCAVFESMDGG